MPVTRSKASRQKHSPKPEPERSEDALPDTVKESSKLEPEHNEDAPSDPTKHSFELPFDKKQIPCELQGGTSPNDKPSLIFTHGAGGGLTNPATQEFASGFAETASVLLFQGTMNLPNRIKAYETVIEHAQFGEALGGRSMGARAAGTIAAENAETKAVVLVSYPLIGKGEDLRDGILLDLPERVDVLFIIGSEDHMCPAEQFEEVRGKMEARSWLVVVKGADHGMSVKPKVGTVPVRRKTGEVAAAWLKDRDAGLRFCEVHWDSEKSEAVAGVWEESGQLGQGNGDDTQPETKKRKVN